MLQINDDFFFYQTTKYETFLILSHIIIILLLFLTNTAYEQSLSDKSDYQLLQHVEEKSTTTWLFSEKGWLLCQETGKEKTLSTHQGGW